MLGFCSVASFVYGRTGRHHGAKQQRAACRRSERLGGGRAELRGGGGGETMDDEPRYEDMEVSAFGGETPRLGVLCVTCRRNRYVSHNNLPKGNFQGREQSEPPPPGGTSAKRRVRRLRRLKTVSKRLPGVHLDFFFIIVLAPACTCLEIKAKLVVINVAWLFVFSFSLSSSLRRNARASVEPTDFSIEATHAHTQKTRQHNKMAVVERSRVLTGICLLIEDCSSIIQPVPRKKGKM